MEVEASSFDISSLALARVSSVLAGHVHARGEIFPGRGLALKLASMLDSGYVQDPWGMILEAQPTTASDLLCVLVYPINMYLPS